MISPGPATPAGLPETASNPGSGQPDRHWLEASLAGKPTPPLLIVIGSRGEDWLGYLDRRGPGTRVLLIEPDAAAAGEFLQRADAREWRAAGRLVVLVDPDYAGADDAWRLFPLSVDAHKLVVNPAAQQAEGAVRAARIAKQIIFGARANAEARRRFAPGYLTATLHNVPEILAGHDVRGLTDAFAGVPAIIAGAGPSLDRVMPDLSRFADRALLIASDTALRPLLNRRLSPQLVVAVDPQPLNARHFQALPPCDKTWLVSESSIDPPVLDPFGRRTFAPHIPNHKFRLVPGEQ